MSLLNRQYQTNYGFNVTPELENLKNVYRNLPTGTDVKQMLSNAAKNNPLIANALSLCSSRSEKDVYYQLCNQTGVNPEQLLNYLQS